MIDFPNIDPIIFELGPLAIRWYSLAYIAGILGGCLYADYLNKKPPAQPRLKVFEDFMTWAIIGIIIGGRVGYVLFYNPSYYLSNPVDALKLWHGGMSFHGGFLGVAAATIIFCRKNKLPIFHLADLAACAAPIGLFFGRVANFINGELYGRVTTSKWGMVFPGGGDLPRHASQLYEAFLEGVVLFIIIFLIAHFTNLREKRGFLSGVFICGYGVSRMIIEAFREPDAHIGFIFQYVTMGQILSLPMVVAGIALMAFSLRRKNVA